MYVHLFPRFFISFHIIGQRPKHIGQYGSQFNDVLPPLLGQPVKRTLTDTLLQRYIPLHNTCVKYTVEMTVYNAWNKSQITIVWCMHSEHTRVSLTYGDWNNFHIMDCIYGFSPTTPKTTAILIATTLPFLLLLHCLAYCYYRYI